MRGSTGGVLALSVVSAAFVLASASGASFASQGGYIVVYRSGVDADAKTTALERQGGFGSTFRYGAALHGFAARLTAQQLSIVESDPAVAFVSPDRELHTFDALAPGESVPTGTRRIGATTTSTAQAAASVNVAVIDSGIDLNYTSELNAVNGKNCIRPSRTAQDDNGHGTHVAGTIGAKNTGTGVVGVAPGTKLYAVKVINALGSGTTAQIICGIDWVTQNAAALNIKVANMSLGGDGANDNNCGNSNADALHAAICNSTAAGISYVVAAGNSSTSFAGFVPASYPEVVTVTALSDSDGQPGGAGGSPSCYGGLDDTYADFSNFAPPVDLAAVARTVAAPGVCINSTWPGGTHLQLSGTSMATPHVTGTVALCISRGVCTAGAAPSSTVSAIETTEPSQGFAGDPAHSPVSGRYYGYIAWASATPPVPPSPPGAPALNAAKPGNDVVTLSWAAPSNGGAPITDYRIYRATTSGAEVFLAHTGSSATSYVDTTAVNGTTYFYEVSAVNTGGEGSLSGEVSATPSADLPLDDFDRGDESPLSDAGRWSNGISNSGEVGLKVASKQVACGLTTTCTAWWNGAQFGPDAEGSVTISTLPGVGNAVRVYARLQSPGSTAVDGYMVRFQPQTGTDQVFIDRIDNGVITTLASLGQEFVAGDKLRIRAVGSTIEAWRNNAGSWSKLGEASDATYAGAGFIGVGLRGTSGRLDDFSGGTAGP